MSSPQAIVSDEFTSAVSSTITFLVKKNINDLLLKFTSAIVSEYKQIELSGLVDILQRIEPECAQNLNISMEKENKKKEVEIKKLQKKAEESQGPTCCHAFGKKSKKANQLCGEHCKVVEPCQDGKTYCNKHIKQATNKRTCVFIHTGKSEKAGQECGSRITEDAVPIDCPDHTYDKCYLCKRHSKQVNKTRCTHIYDKKSKKDGEQCKSSAVDGGEKCSRHAKNKKEKNKKAEKIKRKALMDEDEDGVSESESESKSIKKSKSKKEEKPKKSKQSDEEKSSDDEEKPKKSKSKSSSKKSDDEEKPKKSKDSKEGKSKSDDEEKPKKSSSKKSDDEDKDKPKKSGSVKKNDDKEDKPKKSGSVKKEDKPKKEKKPKKVEVVINFKINDKNRQPNFVATKHKNDDGEYFNVFVDTTSGLACINNDDPACDTFEREQSYACGVWNNSSQTYDDLTLEAQTYASTLEIPIMDEKDPEETQVSDEE